MRQTLCGNILKERSNSSKIKEKPSLNKASINKMMNIMIVFNKMALSIKQSSKNRESKKR